MLCFVRGLQGALGMVQVDDGLLCCGNQAWLSFSESLDMINKLDSY